MIRPGLEHQLPLVQKDVLSDQRSGDEKNERWKTQQQMGFMLLSKTKMWFKK